MKLTKVLSALLFIILLVTFSCQKDDGNSGGGEQENIPDTFSEYFGNDISRDFLGTVIDKNNSPIEGVTITIGNETVLTDNNGVFIIRDANVNEYFGYIKAEKTGYIHGSRSIVPSEGTNKVTIMLLEANVVGTINSGSSETVALANGSSVSFDGNFIKEDGSSYSGSVDVIMHHLDPVDEAMPMQMPGMLYAENEDGAERMLQTLGMLAAELRGTAGEDLNLAEGSTSEIKIPVDASLMNIAPATIPLWYFDEVNGYWKEEGSATLQGNMYVGTVSHFSFWNFDVPVETITLCITLTDESGNALNNLTLVITSEIYGTRFSTTNELGEACGFTPSNESLVLNVYSYDICGNSLLYTENIGPFSSDTNTTIIINTNPDIIEETVIGTIKTCDGDLVTNGYVQITYGNQTFTDSVTDGTFEINLTRCAEYNTFSLSGFDYINTQTTGSINYTFTTPLTDIGNLNACNTITEIVEYTIDDNESIVFLGVETAYAQINLFSQLNGNTLTNLLIAVQQVNNPENCLYLEVFLNESEYVGTYYSLVFQSFQTIDDTGFWFTDSAFNCLDIPHTNNEIELNITSLGDVGEYIDMNFSGNYEDNQGNPHTINGIIHVIRDE